MRCTLHSACLWSLLEMCTWCHQLPSFRRVACSHHPSTFPSCCTRGNQASSQSCCSLRHICHVLTHPCSQVSTPQPHSQVSTPSYSLLLLTLAFCTASDNSWTWRPEDEASTHIGWAQRSHGSIRDQVCQLGYWPYKDENGHQATCMGTIMSLHCRKQFWHIGPLSTYVHKSSWPWKKKEILNDTTIKVNSFYPGGLYGPIRAHEPSHATTVCHAWAKYTRA